MSCPATVALPAEGFSSVQSGAVWAEEAEDLARRDLEVDAAHGLDRAERLRQRGHDDRRAGAVVVEVD
jgi:hypothetical protein